QQVESRLEPLQAQATAYASFRGSPEKQQQVKDLMQNGILMPVKGGTSGVYFLCTKEGDPKFVIKPMDEEPMTLNNAKGIALPFSGAEAVYSPKEGIPLYQSVQNAELGYLIAKEIGIEHATAYAEAMILASMQFADVTDGVTENREELLRLGGEPDRE